MAGPRRHSRASAGTLVYQRNVSDRSKRGPSKNCDTHRAQINSGAFLNKESGRPWGPGFERPPEGAWMLFLLLREPDGVTEHDKISNSKHQITNKSQIPIFNDQNTKQVSNFEFWSLLFVWYLIFVIWNFYSYSIPKQLEIFTGKGLVLPLYSPDWMNRRTLVSNGFH